MVSKCVENILKKFAVISDFRVTLYQVSRPRRYFGFDFQYYLTQFPSHCWVIFYVVCSKVRSQCQFFQNFFPCIISIFLLLYFINFCNRNNRNNRFSRPLKKKSDYEKLIALLFIIVLKNQGRPFASWRLNFIDVQTFDQGFSTAGVKIFQKGLLNIPKRRSFYLFLQPLYTDIVDLDYMPLIHTRNDNQTYTELTSIKTNSGTTEKPPKPGCLEQVATIKYQNSLEMKTYANTQVVTCLILSLLDVFITGD